MKPTLHTAVGSGLQRCKREVVDRPLKADHPKHLHIDSSYIILIVQRSYYERMKCQIWVYERGFEIYVLLMPKHSIMSPFLPQLTFSK
jgi:hypothetical protein